MVEPVRTKIQFPYNESCGTPLLDQYMKDILCLCPALFDALQDFAVPENTWPSKRPHFQDYLLVSKSCTIKIGLTNLSNHGPNQKGPERA